MATGGVVGGKARELNGNHRVAVHGEQPANGAAEVLVARTPALRTRPVDRGDEVLQNIRQKRDHLHRRGRFHGVYILDAVLVAALKSACVNALAASEAQGSLRGVAVGVKRDFRSGAAEGFGQSLGGLGHGERAHDKAARRGVHRNLAMGNARAIERVGEHAAELFGCGMQSESRQLFGADFKR